MTVFDKLKSKNIDELAEWIDEYGQFDGSPWLDYWDDNYCKKCDSEKVFVPALCKETKVAWCELHYKCKFFQEMDDVPDIKQIIKIWLESEYKDE